MRLISRLSRTEGRFLQVSGMCKCTPCQASNLDLLEAMIALTNVPPPGALSSCSALNICFTVPPAWKVLSECTKPPQLIFYNNILRNIISYTQLLARESHKGTRSHQGFEALSRLGSTGSHLDGRYPWVLETDGGGRCSPLGCRLSATEFVPLWSQIGDCISTDVLVECLLQRVVHL